MATVGVAAPERDGDVFFFIIVRQFPPVGHVHSRNKFHAIGPFDATAEVPGQGHPDLRRFPRSAGGQVRNRCNPLSSVRADRKRSFRCCPGGLLPGGFVPDATVFTDAIYRLDHHDVFFHGKTFFNGGQITRRGPFSASIGASPYLEPSSITQGGGGFGGQQCLRQRLQWVLPRRVLLQRVLQPRLQWRVCVAGVQAAKAIKAMSRILYRVNNPTNLLMCFI